MMLDKQAKKEILNMIEEAEKLTTGEIRVHIKSKCKENVFEEAKKIFHKLKMYKTKERNAVLIFIALNSRKFAILGDKGIHEKVKNEFWNETRDIMHEYFTKNQIKEGIILAVKNVGEKLTRYFPEEKDNKNELSNEVTED